MFSGGFFFSKSCTTNVAHCSAGMPVFSNPSCRSAFSTTSVAGSYIEPFGRTRFKLNTDGLNPSESDPKRFLKRRFGLCIIHKDGLFIPDVVTLVSQIVLLISSPDFSIAGYPFVIPHGKLMGS